MYMIVFEQAHTTIYIRVKIDFNLFEIFADYV